jgi:hypothetical protein
MYIKFINNIAYSNVVIKIKYKILNKLPNRTEWVVEQEEEVSLPLKKPTYNDEKDYED